MTSVQAPSTLPPRPAPKTVPEPPTEAFETLCALAHGRTGALPAELLARHVLDVTREADWPVKRAALDAILRRRDFARRDGLRIAVRPPNGLLGLYGTQRTDSSARPYKTRLDSIVPPRGSCDCPDYLRASLGLCKHLLVVLEELFAHTSRRNLDRAPAKPIGRLVWDPIRPLIGAGDWLERLRLAQPSKPNGHNGLAKQWFRDDGTLRNVSDANSTRRLEMVEELLAVADDPAVCALLREERTRLRQALDGIETLRKAPQALRSLKRRLYPYQLAGVRCFLGSGRLLLADDMGLGKTAQAIAVCHVLWATGKVRRGLILVPATLKPQWLREWQLFSDVPITIVDGSLAQREATYRRCKKGFLIANYEQVLRDLTVICRWSPDMVVLDEAQRIKNWATKTATYVKQIQPTYRLVLTGTPMENRLDELASLLDWVDDRVLAPKWRLAPLHSTFMDGRREVAGARNLDTLRLRLSTCLLRRVRKEVLNQLPPRTDTRVSVELTAEQKNEHDDLNLPIARLLARARRRPLTQAEFLRLMSLLTTQRIICNGIALQRFPEVWPSLATADSVDETQLKALASPKLLELRELIANIALSQKRKVVVFSQWRRMLQLAHFAITPVLSTAGARALFFSGQESQKRRTQNLVDFHDDPNARVLLATDAGGVGLNLQRAANCCINLELPWNPAVLEQRIGRIYRLGQKAPVEVYNLVSEDGIEARIASLVSDKRALFAGLFDGASDEVCFERCGSFLSRVEKLVETPTAPELPDSDDEDRVDTVDGTGSSATYEDVSDAPPQAAESHAMPPTVSETASLQISPPAVAKLLAGIDVRLSPEGGVTIAAPPETAAALGMLLGELARKLAHSVVQASAS